MICLEKYGVIKLNKGIICVKKLLEQYDFKENIDLKEKRNAWHKNLSKDLYISEALNVLSQLKLASKQEIVKN